MFSTIFLFLLTFSLHHLMEHDLFFYSQLNFSLFKFFERPFPLTRGKSWGELSSLNSSKQLHQEQKSEREMGRKKNPSLTGDGAIKESFHWCRFLQPVRRLPGVGKTEDGAELHMKDEVKDEQWLFVQSAGDVKLLKTKKQNQRYPCFYKSSFANWHLFIRSYCQTLWEIKAILTESGSCCCAATDGAEESGLVEAQLLQLLRVLSQRGWKQQLLQRHLRWRQTEHARVMACLVVSACSWQPCWAKSLQSAQHLQCGRVL